MGLRQLLRENKEYQQLDADTLEAMAVVLDLPELWENRERYLRDEKEEYDMCKAVREWSAEERRIGRKEGREEGRRQGKEASLFIVVKNMLARGMAETDIMAIAECDREFVARVRESCL